MSRTYSVHSLFDTLQGEGARAGTRAIFLRFSGCNLWDGLEEHRDRGKGACARYCDTDFARGSAWTAEAIVARATELWCAPLALRGGLADPWVVITGGEPSLQIDHELLDALRAERFRIAVETNGTSDAPALYAVDHLCVSPKLGSVIKLLHADELKVVIPGVAVGDDRAHVVRFAGPSKTDLRIVEGNPGWTLEALEAVADAGDWDQLFLSPQDGPDRLANVATAVDFVRRSPRWRLSVQSHKTLGLP